MRWAAAVAEVLVGVSGPVCRMLERQAGRTPVLAVRNGVPVIHPSRRDDGPFTVGTIGHVARTKGTDVFLQAARLVLDALPDVRFEHVGPARIWADEAFDDEVEQLAATPPLREALQMLGRRPAVDELARWSVFVLPSRQEAFPLSTLEAMAAGLPVVASGVGGIPEQIEHLRTGILVPPEDPAVLSAWIVRLREDDELRGRLGAAAREHVRTAFTLEAQARGLAAAYENARAGRPDRRVLG
jgi:glycosyltransferase involved in cell wall biosynthesis